MIATPFVSRAIMYTAFAAALAGAMLAPHTHTAMIAPRPALSHVLNTPALEGPAASVGQRG